MDALAAFALTGVAHGLSAAAEIIVATVSGPVALIELVALAVPIIATVLAVSVATVALAALLAAVIAMLEQIVAALGLGVAHACTAFRTVAVLLHGLLAGLVAVLALRLAFGNKLAACVLVLELGLGNVLLVTVAIAIVLALAAAAGLVARRVLGAPVLALARVAHGLRLVEAPTIHALGAVAHKLKHFGRIVGHFDHLGLDAGLVQQAARLAALLGQHEGDHVARLAGAGGTTGAVHKGLRVGRRLDLHHELHAADVYATGGHVGGHHDTHIAGIERSEVAIALVLVQVAVQLGGRNAVLRQVLGELLGLELGAGEQDAAAFARGEHAHEFVLVAARGFEHVVGHQVGFGGGRIDLVHLGIVQEGVHHFIHAVIERGGEQHVLGVGRNLLKQSLDRWQEAHIGHFVGLIDDHDFDGRERERLLAQQVLKAARAGDHDIGAGLQIADLVDVLDAAVHRGGVHAERVGQRHQHVVDLVRELAGGGQHQAARVR